MMKIARGHFAPGQSYLTRTVLSLFILVIVLKLKWDSVYRISFSYKTIGSGDAEKINHFNNKMDWFHLLDFISQIDIFHLLFYAFIPVVVFFMLLAGRPRESRGAVKAIIVSSCFGLLCVSGFYLALYWRRPDLGFRLDFLASYLYVYVNIAGLSLLRFNAANAQKRVGFFEKYFIVTDIFLPAVVWYLYRHEKKKKIGFLFFLPLIFLAIVIAMPLLTKPVDAFEKIRPPFGMHKISGENYYQIFLDPKKGELFGVIEDGNQIDRFDVRKKESPKTGQIKLDGKNIFQSVGFDPGSHRLIHIDLDSKTTAIIDSDSMTTLRKIPIDYEVRKSEWKSPELLRSRTKWFPKGNALSFFGDGVVMFCPDGKTSKVIYPGYTPGHLVFDPERSQIIVNSIHEPLVAIDTTDFRIKRWIAKPPWTERIAVDSEKNRLFLSSPFDGSLRILNLDEFKFVKKLETFPGVREICLYPERGWLILGGLSPIIEIRKMEDFSIIDRLWAPSTMRSIVIDPDRKMAYIAACRNGLWQLDLNQVGTDSFQNHWRTKDPFFPVLSLMNQLVLKVFGLKIDGNENVDAPEFEILSDTPCTDEKWFQ